MRRNWSLVNAERAGRMGCESCGQQLTLQAAHLIGRSRDRPGVPVDPAAIAWLCGPCHHQYDSHALDLWPVLSPRQLQGALRAAGTPGEAVRRLSGPLWRTQQDEMQHRLDHLTNLELTE